MTISLPEVHTYPTVWPYRGKADSLGFWNPRNLELCSKQQRFACDQQSPVECILFLVFRLIRDLYMRKNAEKMPQKSADTEHFCGNFQRRDITEASFERRFVLYTCKSIPKNA